MKIQRWLKKCGTFLLALMMAFTLIRQDGNTTQEEIFFSAANDQILELTGDTMPFYSGGVLYISSKFFEGTDIGVRYVRNNSMGLAVLYSPKTDLRFHLVNLTVCDKYGTAYNGRAIEKGGRVFFPVALVCQVFGLQYAVLETPSAPLVRLKSDTVVLSDREFVDAATSHMANRYASYLKSLENVVPPVVDDPPLPPPIQAAEGQKMYLILAGSSAEEVRAAMGRLKESKVTFLLTVQMMEDGDLVRELLGNGHEIALMVRSTTSGEIRSELSRARELIWNAAFSLLHLVWYEGDEDMSALFDEQGCVVLTAELDRRDTPVKSQTRANSLLTIIGRYREDLSVYLGYDTDCAGGLEYLISGLLEAQYRLCPWRLTAYMG